MKAIKYLDELIEFEENYQTGYRSPVSKSNVLDLLTFWITIWWKLN